MVQKSLVIYLSLLAKIWGDMSLTRYLSIYNCEVESISGRKYTHKIGEKLKIGVHVKEN